MQEDDVRERISKNYQGLSNSMRKVGEEVLRDLDGTAFLTAAELAERCRVSESSVTRFSMSIGYPGYPEFQRSLQSLLKKKLNIVERLSKLSPDAAESGSTVYELMRGDVRNIQELMTIIDPDAVEAAVEALIGARRRYILGIRSTASLATFFGFYLQLMLGQTTTLVNESEDWSLTLFDAGPEDVVVAFSFPRYGTRTVEAFEFASRRCGSSVAITDGFGSPLARSASIVLPAPSTSISFLESVVAPLSLVNALLLLVGAKESTSLRERLDELEELWKETGSLTTGK